MTMMMMMMMYHVSCRAPSFFTMGAFTAEGPTEEEMAQTSFTMTVSTPSSGNSGGGGSKPDCWPLVVGGLETTL